MTNSLNSGPINSDSDRDGITTDRVDSALTGDSRNGSAAPDETGLPRMLDVVRKCVALFAIVSAIVLGTLVVMEVAQGSVSTFMWVRAGILLAVGPVLYRLALRAAEAADGTVTERARRSFERLRVVTIILPIAIVAVDMIPGVCPAWYAVLQAVSAVPLIVVAIITRRRSVAASFAKTVEEA